MNDHGAWAVFKDGKQISKGYPRKEQATIDAFERGLVLRSGIRTYIQGGCEIDMVIEDDKAEIER